MKVVQNVLARCLCFCRCHCQRILLQRDGTAFDAAHIMAFGQLTAVGQEGGRSGLRRDQVRRRWVDGLKDAQVQHGLHDQSGIVGGVALITVLRGAVLTAVRPVANTLYDDPIGLGLAAGVLNAASFHFAADGFRFDLQESVAGRAMIEQLLAAHDNADMQLRPFRRVFQLLVQVTDSPQQPIGSTRFTATRDEAAVGIYPAGLIAAQIFGYQHLANALFWRCIHAKSDAYRDDRAGSKSSDGKFRRRAGAQTPLFARDVPHLHSGMNTQVVDGKGSRHIGGAPGFRGGEPVQHRAGFMRVEGDEHHRRSEHKTTLPGLADRRRDSVQIGGIGSGGQSGFTFAPDPATGRARLLIRGDFHHQGDAMVLGRLVEGGD